MTNIIPSQDEVNTRKEESTEVEINTEVGASTHTQDDINPHRALPVEENPESERLHNQDEINTYREKKVEINTEIMISCEDEINPRKYLLVEKSSESEGGNRKSVEKKMKIERPISSYFVNSNVTSVNTTTKRDIPKPILRKSMKSKRSFSQVRKQAKPIVSNSKIFNYFKRENNPDLHLLRHNDQDLCDITDPPSTLSQ